MQINELYTIFNRHPSIETDSRKIKAGDLFFALKGPNFNGNQYAQQALSAGAAYVIADELTGAPNDRIILVDDVLTTLQNLAGHHRLQFNVQGSGQQVPFIAITGSNGKTTSKELMHAVLSSTYKTYTTAGNLNNHIGIPLTILKIKPDAEMAIIEMGANHLQEISGYCRYAMPTHGIITNCGKAHLEGFGSEEAIRKGKGELFDYLKQHKGTAFIMQDLDYLQEMAKGIKNIVTYGTHHAAVCGQVKNSSGLLEVSITAGAAFNSIQTNLVGAYNLPNVLLAVAVGKHFSVPDKKIKQALENYLPTNSRSQLLEIDGNKIILDAYNANPTSMKAAIENFAAMDVADKILILGGMMELGNESVPEHQQLVDLINNYTWKQVVLVGGDFNKTNHPYHYFDNAVLAGRWSKEQHFTKTGMLIKGSRSTQMEKILE
jgi:UDP-N-acetylmuramoyl-tripeptide--D-alanyl-D-alanine ligase